MFDFDPGDELALLLETARDFAAAQLTPRLREHEAARGVSQPARAAYAADRSGRARAAREARRRGAGRARARAGERGARRGRSRRRARARSARPRALCRSPSAAATGALRERRCRCWRAGRARRAGSRRATLLLRGRRASACSGRAPWVPSDRADLVVALEAERRAARSASGIALARLPGAGLRAAGASELRLDAAPIAARCAPVARRAARALARARLYVAALLVGTLRHAAEFSRGYALQRVAFGRPIAHHQALAFLITDMHMARRRRAAAAARGGLARRRRGCPSRPVRRRPSREAIEASRFVGPAGVQILGGHGFMQDYPMEKAMREARALGLCCSAGSTPRARTPAARSATARQRSRSPRGEHA